MKIRSALYYGPNGRQVGERWWPYDAPADEARQAVLDEVAASPWLKRPVTILLRTPACSVVERIDV